MCAFMDPITAGNMRFFHKAGAKGWTFERAARVWRAANARESRRLDAAWETVVERRYVQGVTP